MTQTLGTFETNPAINDGGAAEAVVATSPLVSTNPNSPLNKTIPVRISGSIIVTANATTTSIRIRVRVDDINGAVLDYNTDLREIAASPGVATAYPFSAYDLAGRSVIANGRRYVVTVTEIAATAPGTVQTFGVVEALT